MGVIYKFRGRELGLAIAHSEPIVRAAGLVSRQTGRLAGPARLCGAGGDSEPCVA